MLASFVLRLVPEALAQRRIVGRVEAIASGAATAIRSEQELISFLFGNAASDDGPAEVSNESEGVRR